MNLRERKKEATRRALSLAAVELALEHGPENVRVEDIAAAAGVSPRTYNNYFPSREAAICAVPIARNQLLGERLRARPAEEPLDEACVGAVLEHYRDQSTPDQRIMKMIFCNPALHGEFHRNHKAATAPLVEAIAERCGVDPEHDLFPSLLAATLGTAVRIATQHWLEHGAERRFPDVLREALLGVAPLAAAYDRHRSLSDDRAASSAEPDRSDHP
ncbi:TetR/AcrR family transcriptional regulator [Actinocorallia sp. B10E7]|uniref:TetR/AcrR family transcriptional regulator n=1 Tax=Actinocorallia sp. B10E7 TaxID=3153558 RepID=UPI00325DB18D